MAYLVGFGAALPARVVSNAELEPRIGRSPEWIRSVSGIEERRWVNGETVVELGVAAAKDCLDRTGVAASELGMVIVASGTGMRQFPGPASQVAAGLGLTETPALDIPAASAGGLIGMAVGAEMAGSVGRVLVVGSEVMSRVAERAPMEAGTSALFGDGAGACLLAADEGRAKIESWKLGSDGAFAMDLRLEFGEPLWMNGRSVILQATRKLPRVITEVLGKVGITAGEVSSFVVHQANQNLLDKVADTIGVARDRFFSHIAKVGNTSSASVLIAASEWERQRGFGRGEWVCFAAFGAGYHWGAIVARGE